MTKRHNKDTFQIKNINFCTCFGILILFLKSNFRKERTRTSAILNFPVKTSKDVSVYKPQRMPFHKINILTPLHVLFNELQR